MGIVRFGELYAIPSGNGLSRPTAVRGEGYRMIGMGELFANDIITDMEMDRVKMSEKEKKNFFVEEGDLLFARQSLVAAGAGKCSIVKQLIEPTTYESHLIRVRLDKSKCNPWFYYYLFKLQNNPIKAIINQCAQAGIRGNELIRVKVPLVELRLQNHMVSILSAYDSLIETNNKRIKALEQMAENLYKEWFVRFRFPGHETAEFEDSKMGRIPSGFCVRKMQDVISDYIGGGWGNDEEDKDYAVKAYVIRGTDFPNVKRGNVSSCPLRYHKDSNYKSRELHDLDIILEVSGGTAEQPVGRTLLVTQDTIDRLGGQVICASFCKQIHLNKDMVSPYFYYYWMQFLYDTRIIDRFQLQSTGIINFQFEYFVRKGEILLPPKKLMEKFDQIIIPIYNSISALSKQNENLIKQRDLLLPRLMSSKLEV
ncbi:restriction endonuclease subunit S [Ruminococcus difficilis]|uniref:Restriction endonuclease subunit S n=1 Tax=Ruminococcus difficilis TaxID=2763069 RepID=A0A934U0L3_9FIRM|nr:restriction endonuclease subunit S [Ruminococcus difficilis]MBK6088293.1 restriction endonuclease subunit S [Ruminococcus difficilis]